MSDLVKACLKVTGRKYPEGYGFVLTYLDHEKVDTFVLRDAANLIVYRAFALGGRNMCDDLFRYVAALQDAKSSFHWLIEAAQLVHTYALDNDRNAGRTLHAMGF